VLERPFPGRILHRTEEVQGCFEGVIIVGEEHEELSVIFFFSGCTERRGGCFKSVMAAWPC
jgi:hypothetical protein